MRLPLILSMLLLSWMAAPLWAQEAPQAPSMELQAGLLQEAEALERDAKPQDAAKRYDDLIKRYPNHEAGPRAGVGAVRSWIAAGKIKQAEASALKVTKLYGGSHLEQVLAAHMLVAAAHYGATKRDVEAVKRWCGTTLKLFEQRGDGASEGSKTHAAHARFLLGELERDVWLAAKIKGAKPADLKGEIDKKVKGTGELRKRYEQVLQLDEPVWRWAAAYRLIELYELLAQALRESPAPFPAGSEQEAAYRQALEQTVRPMDQTARDQYATLIKQAGERGAGEDAWIKRAEERRVALSARLGDTPAE